MKCPCHSGLDYAKCCKPFHTGSLPPSAEKLMRSRYSAYALGLTNYILETTHPQHPPVDPEGIEEFSHTTQFLGLEIQKSYEKGNYAEVTFVAYLSDDDLNLSFREKSIFEKVDGKWLYLRGEISPQAPHT